MADLNTAIKLVREGQKQEAQKILEPLLEADPSNVQAWFWYVETYPTLEKRVKVLETCLKMNPGNAQVLQALSTLNSQRPAQPTAAAPFTQAPKPVNTPVTMEKTPATPSPSQSREKKTWEQDLASHVDTSTLSKPQPAAKSYPFYEVWMTVLASFDIESYQIILDDPEAGAGRAFEWIAYVGIISGLIAPLSLVSNPQFARLLDTPEFSGLIGNMSTTALMVILALILALITPILSVISLAITAWLQNMIALFFGGMGSYGRTVYAIAAFLAPMTILIALLGIIPLLGQCLTSLLGLYNIVLNVRALRAAHSISTWQALGVMFTPTIILIVLGCLLVFAVGLPGLSR